MADQEHILVQVRRNVFDELLGSAERGEPDALAALLRVVAREPIHLHQDDLARLLNLARCQTPPSIARRPSLSFGLRGWRAFLRQSLYWCLWRMMLPVLQSLQERQLLLWATILRNNRAVSMDEPPACRSR